MDAKTIVAVVLLSLIHISSAKGKSIFAYEPGSTVSKAYTEFTKEVLADGRKKERLNSHVNK